MRARGETHGRVKLTAAQVLAIKAALAHGVTKYRLSRSYGVSRKQIKRIEDGDAWRHLNPHGG